jgi:subtilisin family serine protease
MRAALAVAVVAAGLWATPASAAPPPVTAVRSVTLISGDRLQVAADGRSAGRLPSPGRDDVPLVVRYARGHLSVVPADALPLLNSGRLDPRLFDVTGLLAAGYDDTRGDTPLIVTHGDAGDGAVRAAAGGAPVRELEVVGASAVRLPAARVAALWSGLTGGALDRAYGKVWLDGIATPSTDVSVPLVGAPAAWAAGYTGGGVAVGVLDTGVDAGHPDLAGAVAETADFTAAGDGVDRAGHGTHVASIIAGSGAASAGRNRGMAPDVRLFSAKVCETVCPESAILAGMQWAARDKRVRVVNLSVGRPDTPGADLLETAVEKLTGTYGTLFVVAAGNDDAPVSPASAGAALAVGATDERDAVVPGGHGPGIGDGGLKPDIVAPGVDVTAARSGGSALPGGAYTTRSGTSVAAPHVAGAAALVAQQHPEFAPARIKATLMSTATPLGATADRAGAGRLDVAKAVSSPVTASPGGVAADGGATVTYQNSGTSAMTLALSVAADGPGDPFRLGDTTVTVPARGSATVRVTADDGAPPSAGVLTAASGDLTVRTTLAPPAGPETVALTVRWTGRDGAPATRATGAAYALDGSGATVVTGDGGAGTVRLPRGRYALDAAVFEPGAATTVLTRPLLVLDRDTTVEMDARLGRPVRVTSPRPGASPVYAQVGFAVPTADGPVVAGVRTGTFDGLHTARIGPDTAPRGFRTDVAVAWARRGATGSDRNSPYLYHLAWSVPGRSVTGFERTVDPSSLVEVRSSYGARAAGTTAVMTRAPAGSTGGHLSAFDLPFERIEYLSAGVRWDARFTETTSPGATLTVSSGAPGEARPGAERWNAGVAGPAFPAATGHGIRRDGDTLTVDPSWFSDGPHAGASPAATHRTVVTRAGTVVRDAASPSAVVTVAPGEARFTVTNESTRAATTSTRSRTQWTFRSGRTAGETPLPLPVIRFQPRPGNVLAYSVRHQAGGTTASLGLEVSYDDGKTWRAPMATRIGDHGVAFLRPPPGFVSLRASATDGAGNRVEQTIIRAYATG